MKFLPAVIFRWKTPKFLNPPHLRSILLSANWCETNSRMNSNVCVYVCVCLFGGSWEGGGNLGKRMVWGNSTFNFTLNCQLMVPFHSMYNVGDMGRSTKRKSVVIYVHWWLGFMCKGYVNALEILTVQASFNGTPPVVDQDGMVFSPPLHSPMTSLTVLRLVHWLSGSQLMMYWVTWWTLPDCK